MSTQLRNVPDCVAQNELTQTRFWGGEDRMQCVQITQRRNKNEGKRGPADEWFNHISLDKRQARMLAVEVMLFAEGREVEELAELDDATFGEEEPA